MIHSFLEKYIRVTPFESFQWIIRGDNIWKLHTHTRARTCLIHISGYDHVSDKYVCMYTDPVRILPPRE